MAQLTVQPAQSLHGTLTLPGDKSISHRALLCGAIAQGTTRITHLLDAADVRTTARALADLGVRISARGETVEVEGKGLRGLRPPSHPLDMGNSGTTTRLMMGILAGQPFAATLTGDASLSRRPMGRVAEPLMQMGARITGTHGKDRLPLTVEGAPLKGIRYPLPVPSAQVKSALLLAGLYAEGSTTVVEATPTRDHTERILKRWGARLEIRGGEITIRPGTELRAQDLTIPGDFSSAAFFLAAAAMVPGSSVTVKEMGLNPTRTGLLELLKEMGANIVVTPHPLPSPLRGEGGGEGQDWEPVGEVTVAHAPLRGITVAPERIPQVIDELPILMVAATQAKGLTEIKGAGELRVKETDRIYSMGEGLVGMGAKVRDVGSQIVIEGPTPLKGATVSSFGDHRTAMALAVAGLVAQGPTTIRESEWINISFPEFPKILESIRR